MTVQTDAATTATDQRAVGEVINAYGAAMRAADVAAILEVFTDDAVVMAPGLPTTAGRDQLAGLYRGALDAVAMGFHFDIDEIVIRGDTAVARTHTEGENTVRATGDRMPGRYRELFVLHRGAAGWRIAQYMFQPWPEPAA